MKMYILVLVGLFTYFQGAAQIKSEEVLDSLKNKADSFLSKYKCCYTKKVKNTEEDSIACKDCPSFLITNDKKEFPIRTILPQILDSSFVPIFNTVILNNDNSINVGSAGSIVQSEDGATVNANYAYKLKDKYWFDYFNIGVGAETNGGVWDLYSSNSWRSGISVIGGFTVFGNKNGQYFKPSSCEKLFYKRKLFLNSLLAQYQESFTKKAVIIRRIKAIKDSLGVDTTSFKTAPLGQLSFIVPNTEQSAKLQVELDSLIKLNAELDTLSNKSALPSNYTKFLKKKIVEFELKNMPSFTGYRVWWGNIKGSFGNTRNKLYNDTLSTDSLITFKLSDYARFRFSIDVNWMWNTTKKLTFLKIETSIFNRNFLQNKKMSDLPYIEKDTSGKKYVYTSDKSTSDGKLGTFDNLNKNTWVINPNLYLASFFALEKCIGFEFSAGYKFDFKKLKDVPDPNTYTLYGGIIFRVKKDEVFSKATISVDAGFYDAKHGERAGEDFAFRLKVGLPFNIIAKKD